MGGPCVLSFAGEGEHTPYERNEYSHFYRYALFEGYTVSSMNFFFFLNWLISDNSGWQHTFKLLWVSVPLNPLLKTVQAMLVFWCKQSLRSFKCQKQVPTLAAQRFIFWGLGKYVFRFPAGPTVLLLTESSFIGWTRYTQRLNCGLHFGHLKK